MSLCLQYTERKEQTVLGSRKENGPSGRSRNKTKKRLDYIVSGFLVPEIWGFGVILLVFPM